MQAPVALQFPKEAAFQAFASVDVVGGDCWTPLKHLASRVDLNLPQSHNVNSWRWKTFRGID